MRIILSFLQPKLWNKSRQPVSNTGDKGLKKEQSTRYLSAAVPVGCLLNLRSNPWRQMDRRQRWTDEVVLLPQILRRVERCASVLWIHKHWQPDMLDSEVYANVPHSTCNVVFTLPMRACPVDSLGLADRMTLLTVPKWPNVSLTDSSHSSDLEVLRCNHLFILAGSSPFTVFTRVTSKHSASDACPLTFVEVLMHSVILWFILTA